MKIDVRPRKRNAPRPQEKSAPGFKQWTRGRPCAFTLRGDIVCGGKIEAMHLDFAGGKGMSTKVADSYCLPACTVHHRLQHDKGWDTFCKLMGVTKQMLLDGAARLWRAWPGRVAWERKLESER